MSWFDSLKSPGLKTHKKAQAPTPDGVWKKCSGCNEILQADKLAENFYICPYCQKHFRMNSDLWLDLLLDKNSWQEFQGELQSRDPLEFVDKVSYSDRIERSQEKSGLKESSVVGLGKINNQEIAICVMDFFFMGGSMGVATGEKVATCFDLALEKKIPAVVISCSGGARMQEGILSLMQMAKTSGARQRLRHAGLPYFSILTDPTTGGCAASFAMQGDLNLAEPQALIGFAGPRVIEQSIRQKLPEGFQTAEFLKDHGFVDRIVSRLELRKELAFFIDQFNGKD